MTVVALEEHYVTPDVMRAWRAQDDRWRDPQTRYADDDPVARRLLALDSERLAVMDDGGVDVQVLSLTTPGLFSLDTAEAVALQGPTNDALAEAVSRHPDRLHGFATLAPQNPEAAAAELDRAVRTLGFHGALIFSRVRDDPIDRQRFWPLFEAAEALRAPLYLHPQTPPAAVREAYYSGFGDTVDAAFATYGIGWHYDAGVELLRLIYAGVFDRFPGLQVILGHWGEVAAFYLDRIDPMARVAGLARPVSEYFADHVFLTPGGVFSQRYLRWSLDVVGVDRILFAADYPFVPTEGAAARRFLEESDLDDEGRDKIASGNWEKLRTGIRR
ncbi:amidohydrolase family protein [Mycolicibacterium sp. 3033]|nr:amidohydrolase family protein [Mycolicibacterium aurantiacum]